MSDLDDLDFEELIAVESPAQFQDLPRTLQNFPAEIIEKTQQGQHSPLIVDIETVPDESRMALFDLPALPSPPTETPSDVLNRTTIAAVVAMSVEGVGKYVESINPPDSWLDTLAATENAREKGPRDGVLKLIKAKRGWRDAAKNDFEDRVKTLSVNPLYCRICALGVIAGDAIPRAMLIEDDEEERKALAEFWRLFQVHRQVVGYNVLAFDLRVILVRSIILGVPVPRIVDRRKFGSRDVLDLMIELFPDGRPMGMKAAAKCLGIRVADDHGNGSQVYQLYKAGDWAAIEKYLFGDLRITEELYQKLSGVFFA